MISFPILTITGVSFSRRPRTNSKLVIGTFRGFLFCPTNFYIWWDHRTMKGKYSHKRFWPRWSDTHIQRQIDDSVKPQPNNSKSPSSFVSLTCSNVSFHRFSIIEGCWVIIYCTCLTHIIWIQNQSFAAIQLSATQAIPYRASVMVSSSCLIPPCIFCSAAGSNRFGSITGLAPSSILSLEKFQNIKLILAPTSTSTRCFFLTENIGRPWFNFFIV